jgi:tRNA(fMet)-specific endonuclease VapC
MRGWISALAKAKSPKAELPIYSRLVSHVDAYRRMKIVPFEEAAFEQMESFRQQRIRLGTMDLKIAAIVMAVEGVLVTRNVADFEKIPDLQIEDWSKV